MFCICMLAVQQFEAVCTISHATLQIMHEREVVSNSCQQYTVFKISKFSVSDKKRLLILSLVLKLHACVAVIKLVLL